MTSGLAHEIKNPLSTIGLNAQLLGEAIEDLPIDDQEKGRMGRRVGALRNETDRLRGILEDFLEYAGELRLDKHLTDLNDLIEQLGDFFHVQAQSNGVQIRLDPSPVPVTQNIDANHIKQAVLNLMINAVNAMKEQTESGKDLILRVTKHQDDSVSIHVTDTGPGIDQADQERIFHPYFTTRASGTGLGLPTARRIAEAHGGSLELHSEPGKGSDFAIHLPADASEQVS
jgi:signal transduction histidine kinase